MLLQYFFVSPAEEIAERVHAVKALDSESGLCYTVSDNDDTEGNSDQSAFCLPREDMTEAA